MESRSPPSLASAKGADATLYAKRDHHTFEPHRTQTMLPTPLPSTEIVPQLQGGESPKTDSPFTLLPPAALQSRRSSEQGHQTGSSKGLKRSFSPTQSLTGGQETPSSVNRSNRVEHVPTDRYDASQRNGVGVETQQPLKRRRTGSQSTSGQKKSRSSIQLPSPPTRPRRIIQMRVSSTAPAPDSTPPSIETKQVAAKLSTTTGGGNTVSRPKQSQSSAKKIVNGTTAATSTAPDAKPTGKAKAASKAGSATAKKTARKTAHSVIERRRRLKMNEAFEDLRQLVPACSGSGGGNGNAGAEAEGSKSSGPKTGADMHKLAILQAAVEYVRYLKTCLEKVTMDQPEEENDDDHYVNHNDHDDEEEDDDEDADININDFDDVANSDSSAFAASPHAHIGAPTGIHRRPYNSLLPDLKVDPSLASPFPQTSSRPPLPRLGSPIKEPLHHHQNNNNNNATRTPTLQTSPLLSHGGGDDSLSYLPPISTRRGSAAEDGTATTTPTSTAIPGAQEVAARGRSTVTAMRQESNRADSEARTAEALLMLNTSPVGNRGMRVRDLLLD